MKQLKEGRQRKPITHPCLKEHAGHALPVDCCEFKVSKASRKMELKKHGVFCSQIFLKVIDDSPPSIILTIFEALKAVANRLM